MSSTNAPKKSSEEEAVLDFDAIREQEKRDREALKRKAQAMGMGVKKRAVKRSSVIEVRNVPRDATVNELAAWAKKAGVIKLREENEEPLIRVVPPTEDESEAQASGAAAAASGGAASAPQRAPNDATAYISFLFPESVEQAQMLLDESYLRASGKPLKISLCSKPEKEVFDIQRAQGRSKKVRVTSVAEQRQKALSWKEDKYEKRHVIVQNLFDPAQIAVTDLTFYTDLADDLRAECEAKCGPVETLKVFERSPLGAAAIKFDSWLGADRCIRLMHGRWFDKRKLACDYYDGKTNYVVQETDEEKAARSKAFGEWLEDEEEASADGK